MGEDGFEHIITSRDHDSTSTNAPRKYVYSRDFLLGFSKLEHCQIRPVGLDPVLLRDQAQLNVGTPSTSSGFGKHRSERISEWFPDRQWQRPPSLIGRSIRQTDVKKTDFNNNFSRSAPTSGGFMLSGAMAHPKVIEHRDGLLGSGEQNSQRDSLELKEQLRKNIDEHKGTQADVSRGTACFIPLTFSQSFSPGSRKDNDMVIGVKGQYGDKNREVPLATSKISGKQEIVHETSLPYTENNARQEIQHDIMNRARLLELLRMVAHESRSKSPRDYVADNIVRETKENKDEEGDKILLLESLLGKDFINELYAAAKQASISSTNSSANSSSVLKEENKAFVDALQIAQLRKLLNDTALPSSTYSPYVGDIASAINSLEMNGQKTPFLFPGMISPSQVSPGLQSGRLSPGLPSGQLSPGLPSGQLSPGLPSGQLSPGLLNMSSGRLSPGLPNVSSGRLSPGLSPGDSPVSPFAFGARRGTGSFMPDYSKQQKGKKHVTGGLPPASPNTVTQKELPTSQDKNKNTNNKTSNKITSPSSTSSPWPPNFPFHLLQGNFIPSLGGSQSPWGIYGMPLALPLDSSEQVGLNLMQQLQFQVLNAKLPLEGWLEACQYLQAPEAEITSPTLAASLNQLQGTRSLDQLLRTRTFA